MKKQVFLSAAVILILGGCTMAPKYTRPTAPIPEQLPSTIMQQEVKDSKPVPMPINLGWLEFFPDNSMQKIIQLALENNRDLRLAALNVERARGMYGIQGNELYPSIYAGGSKVSQRSAADLLRSGEPQRMQQYSVSLGITSWEIDFFGRIRSLKAQALQAYLGTKEARRSAQISVVSAVAQAYLSLAADRDMLKLAKSTFETRKSAYALIRDSYKAGVASELDLERAKTQKDAARGEIARASQQVEQDKNALNLLAGGAVPGKYLPEGLDTIKPPKGVSPGLSSEVLLQRPDILMAESTLKGENAAIGAARAALFPRISLTTAVGRASRELTNLFDGGNRTWNFVPQLSIPIFDARTWSALKVQKANRKIALAAYEKAIQTAFREVADALAVKSAANEQLAAQQSIVNSTKKIYDLSNMRFAHGIDGYLGVLDAERSLYAAKQGLVSLRLMKLANEVRLYAVLGGGDKAETVQKESSLKEK